MRQKQILRPFFFFFSQKIIIYENMDLCNLGASLFPSLRGTKIDWSHLDLYCYFVLMKVYYSAKDSC